MTHICSLYLNVWTPATATKDSKLPVKVWVYGGSDKVVELVTHYMMVATSRMMAQYLFQSTTDSVRSDSWHLTLRGSMGTKELKTSCWG